MNDKKASKLDLLSRITYILVSIFITATIFATMQKAFGDLGIGIGLIINIAIAIALIKDAPKGTRRSVLGYTVIWTVVVMSLFIGIGMVIMKSILDNTLA